MAARDTIARLVAFEGRWPGTEAEERAAGFLAGELKSMGREAELEPMRIRPAYHLAYALHCALAVAGGIVSVYFPALGVALLLLAAVSMYGDLTTRFHLLRRLLPRRSSQNVTSRGGNPDAPARIVLTAHYDAARSGLIFNRRRRPLRPLHRFRRLAGPIDLVFWTMVVALLLAVARLLLGVEADEVMLLTAAQFVATALLMIAFTLFVDVALSDVVPGANDNASGVAAALELGRRLGASPPANLDVWIVFTGASEATMLGMREWMRAHSDEVDPRRTFFLNLDSVGSGKPRPVAAEGFVIIYQHDLRLVRLAEPLAALPPLVLRLGTDGVVPAMRGFPSLTVCCTDEHDRLPHRHRQSDTPEHIDSTSIAGAVALSEKVVRGIDSALLRSQLPSLNP